MTATFYVGDAIQVMNSLPAGSVDLVLTSPPFLALRSYLPADHPDKTLEGGSQSTPGEYLDWLLDVVEACARVLAPHGSLVFELGDTYAGSGGAGGDYYAGGWREGERPFDGSAKHARIHDPSIGPPIQNKDGKRQPGGKAWAMEKSLSLIPESFRWAMVYGHNPFTGRQCDTWRLRNVIRWVRPNPPVGALGDKFRPATSELMVFCKTKDRYFDLDAVREPFKSDGSGGPGGASADGGSRQGAGVKRWEKSFHTQSGAPPLDWWKVRQPCQHGQYEYHVEALCKHGQTHMHTSSDWACAGPDHCIGAPEVGGGAPPLDWWNIPLLDGDEETRYGPKERDGNRPASGAPKEQQVHDEQRQVRSERRERGKPEGIIWTNAAMANRTYHKDGGAPPLDWWNIPPGGYSGAHYAVFPPELLIKPIKAMCPEKVCRVCGEPSRRIVENSADYQAFRDSRNAEYAAKDMSKLGVRAASGSPGGWDNVSQNINGADRVTLGFSDCGHDDWRLGLVLDPFGGSGTTALVATGHGRDCILIDLDSRNYDLALERVGPFILTLAETPTD